jgi:type IV pilus assembly protein PilE
MLSQALSDLRVRMEQYFNDNRTYVGRGVCSKYGGAVFTAPTAKYFVYCLSRCNSLTATTYFVTATGINPGRMAGFSYAVDQSNIRSSLMVAPSTWIGCNANLLGT